MKLIWFGLAVILSCGGAQLVFAGSVYADPCPSLQELDTQIVGCGRNKVAVAYAKKCLAKIQGGNVVALATLKKAQASGDRRSLSVAIQLVEKQVALMQTQTEKVANYASLMIDDPTSTSRETSLDCFNTAFDGLQKIVNAMDEEIIRAKDARNNAVQAYKSLGK